MNDTIEPMITVIGYGSCRRKLVESTHTEGGSLIGPCGLLTVLTKTVLETALEGRDGHVPWRRLARPVWLRRRELTQLIAVHDGEHGDRFGCRSRCHGIARARSSRASSRRASSSRTASTRSSCCR